MTNETPKTDISAGSVVKWNDEGETGKIMALSMNGKAAFVRIGYNLFTGKPRVITVSVQRLEVLNGN